MCGAVKLTAVGAVVTLVLGGVISPRVVAQEKKPSVSSAWVKLPVAGDTTAHAFAVVENPTMYDFYVLSATTDVAGRVEIRRAGKDGALSDVTVPAYGSLTMDQKGVHLLLHDLKKPLNENDKVSLTLVTEVGSKLDVVAVVKKD
jgi:copper(I)-binding protein